MELVATVLLGTVAGALVGVLVARYIRGDSPSPFGPWRVLFRCPCGRGHRPAQPGEQRASLGGDNRWLCCACGTDATHIVRWVGRSRQVGPDTQWEWLERPIHAYLVDESGLAEFEAGLEFTVLAGSERAAEERTLSAFVPRRVAWFLLLVNKSSRPVAVHWDQV